MLYGAYGFTGKQIAREAVRRGFHPLLAGRNKERLLALGNELMLPTRYFPLSSSRPADHELQDVDLVVHAAGPFRETGQPMIEACLRTKTDYIDISGELSHFRNIYGRHDEARKGMITMIPGCGFDVVPTDSLAAFLKSELPEATHLELAIDSTTTPSAGTAKAATGIIAEGGYIRKDKELIEQPLGVRGPNVRFHRGERRTIVAPFADLITAWETTSIPSITTYLALPPGTGWLSSMGGVARALLTPYPLRRLVNAGIDLALKEKEKKSSGSVSIWGRVTDAGGRSRECWMNVQEPYRYTAAAVVNAVERFVDHPPSGILTPTEAFGVDFALEVPGTVREERLKI